MGMMRAYIIDLLKTNKIGDWSFSSDFKDMFLVYPCKSSYPGEPDYGDVVHLPIHRKGESDDRKLSWEWDGNKEAPTISPSVNVIGRWHGFFRNGNIETL
jgi:hypothetical protein